MCNRGKLNKERVMRAFIAVLGTSFVMVVALMLAEFPAQASGQVCYTPTEAEAEQAIRIHSELMVIGLNCQHMTPPNQENLYSQYREFTSKNENLLHRYEEILIDYFDRAGAHNPVGKLNDMRTAVANRISNDAARMRPDIFCQRYADRIEQASRMNQNQIRQWASTFFPSHPASRPICQQQARAMQ